MPERDRIILIDADVVSHFISGERIDILPGIFPFRIALLDRVYAELEKRPRIKHEVDRLIALGKIDNMAFPDENEDIKKEYFHLKKFMFKGDGEAACMAVVRYSRDILASSNLRDIKAYCQMHAIDYLTTMDFLCEALRRGIMTEAGCDEFIRKVKAAKRKLPVERMKDYRCGITKFITK